MKIIHQNWQLVGQVLIVDDEGNAITLGKDQAGNDARIGTVTIGVERFRGGEFDAAYRKAREACEELLAKYQMNSIDPDPDALSDRPSLPESFARST